jgi:uncharacterized Fe-S cluster-containing radical SAM superfamily protein
VTMRDPDEFSAALRSRSIDTSQRRVLLSILGGSAQEPDLSEPVVCGELGRIRHFRRATSQGWPENPLPIIPAARRLGLTYEPDIMRALVYQNAVCNWRCWYCFVPFSMLGGHEARSQWATSDQLVDLYRALPDGIRPSMIDLSGGQPDLVPEWTIWMIEAIREAGLTQHTYLWGDDNLSNDYLFRYLTDDQLDHLIAAPNYGRVCCLKGFDSASFTFNTGAPAEHFYRQFALLRRIVATGMDVYCYATFTSPERPADPLGAMERFVDRLQDIDEHLPLRLIPLEINVFGPVEPRMRAAHVGSLQVQQHMVTAWQAVLAERFSEKLRGMPVVDVPLTSRA